MTDIVTGNPLVVKMIVGFNRYVVVQQCFILFNDSQLLYLFSCF